MKTNKKLKKTALVSGALLTGSLVGLNPLNANSGDLFDYSDLGSGAELRSELLEQNQSPFDAAKAAEGMTTIKFSELKCGEGKCGEGKCGEDEKKEAKKDGKDKTEKASKDSKKASAKPESDKKEGKKEAKKDKTSESKCGEGKCG